MILLDTNVVSEPMRPKPNQNVLAWLGAQAAESLYLTTISLGELLLGIASLPTGKRRKALGTALEKQIVALFDERIVPFDINGANSRQEPMRPFRRSSQPPGCPRFCQNQIGPVQR